MHRTVDGGLEGEDDRVAVQEICSYFTPGQCYSR